MVIAHKLNVVVLSSSKFGSMSSLHKSVCIVKCDVDRALGTMQSALGICPESGTRRLDFLPSVMITPMPAKETRLVVTWIGL